jgi:signal transduction histidine kinase
MTATTDINELKQTALFKDVPVHILQRVLAHTAPQQLAAGAILLTPERTNRHLYLLLSGSLSLRFDAPDSPEVRELPAGVSVGEMSAIDDARPSAYVIAKEASRVLPIPGDLLQQLVAESHPVARNLLHLTGQWLKANTRHIANDQSQIQRLTATIRRVTAQGLDQRIPTGPEDRDFAGLIAVFNEMLERLERSFKQASRFSGDAAHELKTPLAILQGQIEQALNREEAGSAHQIMLSGILDEVGRLSSISKKLLLLSQADAGQLSLHREPVNLSVALQELAEDARMLAPQLQVRDDIEPGLNVQADAALLRQILLNLLSNAIKYNIAGGWIHLTAVRQKHRMEICIANASHDIPATERALLFERFYRADSARSQRIEGAGLGLSLAREIARAHGGDLLPDNNLPHQTAFRLLLPVDSAARPDHPI